jgi:hypothetical protein
VNHNETDWYAQLCALFTCTIGDFAVVRYCIVVEYADEVSPRAHRNVKRTHLKFETERQRGITKIKYDVIPTKWIVGRSKFEFENLPPYIYPDFQKGMAWPPPRDLMAYHMVDAYFFR